MSRIYVAGKWEEKERVREVQAQLVAAGHTITHDWTTEEPVGDAYLNIVPSAVLADKQGVMAADAFVGIFEKDLRYLGAVAELGMAIARGIPVYILGNAADRCIFVKLPEVKRGLEELLHGKSVSSKG